ncbi:DENN domain-containing protein 2D, putative [Entamoeba dispar SAW760]|uniref:DENN domain-containing protein 2D, putative n=1 Tax=Entamoeba dispar (strain ATCC PRA-260 / SAW760) TaxID=370354 RepID=B0EE18_ENTDS|nr:DENN domain-containing protein 2D, putative [Entamoeba dispar SAW760]EDR27229.1 DENN domain-containing protein 2D, putative [Entamoeba dispar SAW760]|eukprot:EDR27229.1 DENN domain-containing protein 2D, putative [Entamoeba dispar SAW760]
MGERLVEDIILLRCNLVNGKINKECIYQYVVGDVNQQNTIFPFCFSEGETLLTQRNLLFEPTIPEIFTFMLTDVNGTRKYAYCLRFPHFKEPECLCIIGTKPLTHLFEEILKIAKKLRLLSIEIMKRFLDDICLQPIPLANEVLSNISFHYLPYQIINSDELNDHSNHDVSVLLKTFGASMLVDLIGYLLVERKFLFVSQSIQSLSEFIMAFTSLVSPFQWQHVFIPVLPLSLVTYCAAPMPYVIGVKNNFLPNVYKDCGKMDDTIVLDVDSGKLLNNQPLNFPLVFISNETTILKAALTRILHHLDENSNELIYCLFHKFFASIFDGYQKYLKFDSQKQKAVFQMEEYEEYLKQVNVENYTIMKSFEESQMCYMFFKEREEQIQQGLQLTSLCPLLKIIQK